MQKSVLLATGIEDLNRILRENFRKHDSSTVFKILDHDVIHLRYLQEITNETHPDIILFHDQLHSQFAEKEEREQEWIEEIEKLRRDFNDEIRIVFICERSKYDPFLGELVSSNVLDIYRTRKIDLMELVESLLTPPKYSKVASYKDNLNPRPKMSTVLEEEEDEGEEDDYIEDEPFDGREKGEKKPPDEQVSRIKEKGSLIQLPKFSLPKREKREKPPKPPKIVEQKIVNKQVIKRE